MAAPAPAIPQQCLQCRQPIPVGAPHCPKCGWDRERVRRCCVACGNRTLMQGGSGLSGQTINGVVGAVAFSVAFTGGMLGALAVGGILGAIGNAYRGLTLAYRCASCKREVSNSVLSKEERGEIQGQRTFALFGAGGLALLGVVSAVIWVLVVVRRATAGGR